MSRYLGLVALLATIAIVVVVGFHFRSESGHQPWNVVLVSIDTLRADRLGAYGYERAVSPHLDELAEEAVVFENAYVAAPWTLPSHMSLFTSLYPTQHGVMHETRTLRKGIRTLAESLASHGYRTAGFTGGGGVAGRYGFDRGFESYVESYSGFKKSPDQGWRFEHLQEDMFRWIDTTADEPFFLFVHTYDVHEPFLAHEDLQVLDPGYDGPLVPLHDHDAFSASVLKGLVEDDPAADATITRFLYEVLNEGHFSPSDADKRHLVALYDNEVAYVDRGMGSLFQKLEEDGLLERTLVVVTSDHGEELFERGRVQHGETLYEEILRVPLLMWIPGYAGGRSSKLVSNVDIAPTILDLLQLPPEPQFCGNRLFPLARPGHSAVVAEDMEAASLRTEKHKLVFGEDGAIELYAIDRDPAELHDISEEQPERVSELLTDAFGLLGRVELDEEHIEQLRAMGYLRD